MTARSKGGEGDPKRDLLAEFEASLGTAMGVRLTPVEWVVRSRDAIPLGLAWLVSVGGAAAFAFWWAAEGVADDGHARLLSLNLWIAVHFSALIAMARVATLQVIDIVGKDIIPFASDEYARAAREILRQRNGFMHLQLLPLATAAIGVAAAAWALDEEMALARLAAHSLPFDMLVWLGAFFFASFAAMRAVIVGGFPRAFAVALEPQRQSLYPLCAAQSPLVQGLAKLNRTMLIYWLCVFLILATVMLLVLPPEPFGLDEDSPFLFIFVPAIAFFSLGVGTYSYLRSEWAVATALRRHTLQDAQPLQLQIAALIDRNHPPDEATAATIERLTQLHDRIIAGGRYGSRIGTAVSLALPLAMPAIGLAEKLFR